MLTEAQYREFSLAYSAAVLSQLLRHSAVRPVPVILFTKGGGQWLEAMAAAGFDALGLDWTTGIGDARRRVGSCVALQGNLDPVALYASTDVIRKEVGKILESYGFGSGHVFNLGHGILPDVDPDHVGAMVEAVRELSPKFHSKDAAL